MSNSNYIIEFISNKFIEREQILYALAYNGCLNELKIYINDNDKISSTLLEYAIFGTDIATINYLLEKNVEINEYTLMITMYIGNKEVMSSVVDYINKYPNRIILTQIIKDLLTQYEKYILTNEQEYMSVWRRTSTISGDLKTPNLTEFERIINTQNIKYLTKYVTEHEIIPELTINNIWNTIVRNNNLDMYKILYSIYHPDVLCYVDRLCFYDPKYIEVTHVNNQRLVKITMPLHTIVLHHNTNNVHHLSKYPGISAILDLGQTDLLNYVCSQTKTIDDIEIIGQQYFQNNNNKDCLAILEKYGFKYDGSRTHYRDDGGSYVSGCFLGELDYNQIVTSVSRHVALNKHYVDIDTLIVKRNLKLLVSGILCCDSPCTYLSMDTFEIIGKYAKS